MEGFSDVTSSSPRWSGSSTASRSGRARSSSRARPESERPRCGSRASGAQRNGVCGLSTHSQLRASRSCRTLRSRIWSSRRSMRWDRPSRVQQRARRRSRRDDAGDGTSARTTATAFVGVLAACAEKGAVLLAVDDVQWLDSASAETLAFALRRLPPKVGVLLAHRVEAGGLLPLGSPERCRGPTVAHRPPSALACRAPSPGEVPPRHVASAAASAPGRCLRRNPFALEMARALAPHGDLKPAQPCPSPATSRSWWPRGPDLVAARTAARARRGRHLAADPVRPCLGASADADFGAALLEAEEAGVLTSEDDRIRFRTHSSRR